MALSPILLASQSVAGQSSFLRDLPPGKYEGFFIKLSGDAAAGEELSPATFGRIRLLQEGRPIVNVDFEHLQNINQIKAGFANNIDVSGGDQQYGVLIPRGYLDDNVQAIIEADNVQIEIEFGATFTTIFTATDTAVIKVYGLVRETGEMAYNLNIIQEDHLYGTGVFELPIRTENVVAVYIVPDAGLDRMRATKDGREFVNISSLDQQYLSDLVNQVESAGSGIMAAEIAEPGAVGEFLSDDVVLEFTTSPATTYTQTIVKFSADFDPIKLRLTRAENAAVVQRKISRKNLLGRGRPVQTLRIAAQS